MRFFAGVQMDLGLVTDHPSHQHTPDVIDLLRPRDKLKQKSCVAAVRVAVRSLADEGLRRSHDCQHAPE